MCPVAKFVVVSECFGDERIEFGLGKTVESLLLVADHAEVSHYSSVAAPTAPRIGLED
jgi:hypothetical protein